MPTISGLRLAVRHLSTPGMPANRALRFGLAGLALLVALHTSWLITSDPLLSVDLEIPLRAAARFAAGGQPYLASAFLVPSGPALPFLYPPYLLPLLVPLLGLPQVPLLAVWFGVCLAAAAVACRRLAIPIVVVPLILIWPAFWEGIWHGNVEILIFAAFVALFFERPGKAPYQPVDRTISPQSRATLHDGLLAVGIAVIKPLDGWAWLQVLRRHVHAAILGAALAVALVLATLPMVGVELWTSYAAQIGRAADPRWTLDAGLGALIPGWPSAVTMVASLVLATLVPRRSAGAWLGLLVIIGTPTLHPYGLIYLLPALLRVRREVAIMAVILESTLGLQLIWLAVAITAGAMILGSRIAGFLEPTHTA